MADRDGMKTYGTLLVIDDEEAIGEFIADIFSTQFEKVICCHDGKEGVIAAQNNELSAIITDISMPGMPGDQLVRKIRATGDLTPIIFLTGHATKEVVLSALRLGVANVFEKPFEKEFLVSSVNRVLEIEKRKRKIYSLEDPVKIAQERKLLGLLHVVNETKKTA